MHCVILYNAVYMIVAIHNNSDFHFSSSEFILFLCQMIANVVLIYNPLFKLYPQIY